MGVTDFAKWQYAGEGKLREMLKAIRSIFKSRSLDEWLQVLSKEDVPCGPVYELNEVFEDPQTLYRKMIVEAEHLGVGKIKLLGIPLKFSETPCEIRSPPPRLGEHTEQILRWLRYGEGEILDMRKKGVM